MSKVKCELCNQEYSAKGGIVSHLKKCSYLGEFGVYKMLKVSGLDNQDYFIYILMDEDETLHTLDLFLKAIWLECCGHLSQFYVNPNSLNYYAFEDEECHGPIISLLCESDIIYYDYDFGSTTTLKIEFIKDMVDYDSTEPIVLLARNENPFKNKDNSPRAGECAYSEDINYRMTFTKNYQEYCKDRKALLAYTKHEISEEFANEILGFSDMEDDREDYIELDEFEEAAMEFEYNKQRLLDKYNKSINDSLSLKEALERLTKDQLVELSKSNLIVGVSKLRKSALIDKLEVEIPKIFRERLSLIDPKQLEMYARLKDNRAIQKDDMERIMQNDLFFVESTNRHFLWFGMGAGLEMVYVIPQELKVILIETDLNALRLKAQSNAKIIQYAKGLLNIYGVLYYPDLLEHVCHHLEISIDEKDFHNIVKNACCFYSEISHSESYYSWRNTEDAEEILEERELNVNTPWKELTPSEIEKAGQEFYYPDNVSFGALKKLLIKHVDIPKEGIEMILNSVFELTTRFTDPEIIIAYMAEVFIIEELKEKDEVEIINALEQLYYNCSMRVYKGFSMNEMD